MVEPGVAASRRAQDMSVCGQAQASGLCQPGCEHLWHGFPLAGRARLEHPGITITIHDPIPIARTMTRVKWSPEGDPVGI
ncbi:hypothetical protein ACFQAT_00475 [Undibacterium arcticum]|uniref:Uncharacterized protein n=1 Tax=Undibacterium arcticum TaxID=1762892 RepID=A0ABV7EY86_9BURK